MLSRCENRTAALPIANGHDIWPVCGQPDRLWVVATNVFQYDKRERRWIIDFEGCDRLRGNNINIKSCACDENGSAFRTFPNGTYQIWDTDCLEVLWKGNDHLTEYRFENAAFYRARLWCQDDRAI